MRPANPLQRTDLRRGVRRQLRALLMGVAWVCCFTDTLAATEVSQPALQVPTVNSSSATAPAPATTPEPPRPTNLFLEGETLDFEISWGLVTAGTARMVSRAGPRPELGIYEAFAANNGFFESVYPVRDTVRTHVRRADLLPWKFTKVLNEGGWHSRSRIDFDIAKRTAHLGDSVLTDEGKLKRASDTTVTLDGASYDIFSAFYLFRTLPLKSGQESTFRAVSGKKKYLLKVIVHGRERVTVPAGTFDCVLVEPVLADDGLFKAKGRLLVYLSDDARRIPVLVTSKIALGSIKVSLTKRMVAAPKAAVPQPASPQSSAPPTPNPASK